MSKIFAPNKQFSGLRAGISFINGVSETEDEYLKSWFRENGYQVEDDEECESLEDKLGDLPNSNATPDQKQDVNLCKGELETLKKAQLQEIAKSLELEFNDKTTCEQLIEMIKIAKEMED